MAKPKRSPYVETRGGLRAFFLCLLLAAVFGCGFRLYFSPQRLKAWVNRALDKQKATMAHPFALSFSDASLRLSDSSGYLPQLAVVVSGVKVAPNPECHPEASIFIGELRLPFRVSALLAGRAAVGVIGARDITVDLDGLRARCETAAEPPAAHAAAIPQKKADIAETAVQLTAAPARDARLWWTSEQFETVRSFVQGFEFSRAVLQFENKTKEVDLDSFSARLTSDGVVRVQTEIRIPPSVSFGETLPAFKIQGEASASLANLNISARVSEGSLETSAKLEPAAAGESLKIAASMNVKSLPLSMLSPLLRKSGVTNDHFQPKFMWMDCTALIEGPFQGLFQTSPLNLKDCRIEGDGTDITLTEASRMPDASWKPFSVKVHSLDLAKLFATVGVKGPEGVANDFGKLSGDVRVESNDEALFDGQLKNATLHFSNRKVRASQLIEVADVAIVIGKHDVNAKIQNVKLKGGQLKGHASFEMDRTLATGRGELQLEDLSFAPEVQNVLVGGQLGKISGAFRSKIEKAQFTDFEADLKVARTEASDFEFDSLIARSLRKGDEPPKVVIETPRLFLKQTSTFYRAIEPVFFGSQDEGDLKLEQPHLELRILSDGDIEWASTRATTSRGRILLSTNGMMNRDHVVDGSLKVEFPKIKNLKWTVKGPLNAPLLKGASDELTQLKARAEITDKVLGL